MKKIAFLFPGEGSQSIGMLSEMARQSPLVKNIFDEASQGVGINLWKIVQEGPEDQLNQTEVAQPAMLAAGVACWRVWKEAGGFDPDFMAGHSLGEYAALVASGWLDFGDAIFLVAERARRMQAAIPAGTGATAAILGLDDYTLRQICISAAQGEVVACTKLNGPIQIIIGGNTAAVDRVCTQALKEGARRAERVPNGLPSHCELMRQAAMDFSLSLSEVTFTGSTIPVVQNADLQAHTTGQSIRMALEKQIWQPVRWVETIKELENRSVPFFAECGPGKVLYGLNRRIIHGAQGAALTDINAMQKLIGEWN